MTLVPYTNTYVDTDGSIADSDDIVDEFYRVAEFIAAWSNSYQTIGISDVTTHVVPGNGSYDIDPSEGMIQSLMIDAGISELNINFTAREDGDPYRIYLILRFGSKDSRYTVSGPSGQTVVFGINRSEYSPSQTLRDDSYAGVVIATYGTDALHLQVYAHNEEITLVGNDDILQGVGT